MQEVIEQGDFYYMIPATRNEGQSWLVAWPGSARELRFPFYDRIQFGRYRTQPHRPSSVLYLKDQTISRWHTVISQGPDARFYIRDLSRNGTFLDGLRIESSTEVELHSGQRIKLGRQPELTVVLTPVVLSHEETGREEESSGITQGTMIQSTAFLVGTPLEKTSDGLNQQHTDQLRALFSEHRTAAEVVGQENCVLLMWRKQTARIEENTLKACTEIRNHVEKLQNIPAQWTLLTSPDMAGSNPRELRSLISEVIKRSLIMRTYNSGENTILACKTTHELASSEFGFRLLESGCEYFAEATFELSV
ncbi:MAG: FHA domain-containing protein [Myxococcota bacterium]|nr:FHA domain-containing protein [Myxococcota bacterium]